VSVIDELRAGALSESFVALLYRQVAVVAKVRNFPPPHPYTAWSKDAVLETAHDFLTSEHTSRRLVELAARADDDESFERLLGVAVLNYLREQGRKTTLGRLVRRLRPLFGADTRFVFVPEGEPGAGNVALASAGSNAPYAGPTDVLREAAQNVSEVTIVRWNPNTRREAPVADTKSLMELSAAVLGAARGSMPVADLAHVLASRLGVDPRRIPATMYVDDLDVVVGGEEIRFGVATNASELTSDLQPVVDGVIDQLSERERLVLAWLHETVRVIADHTGLAASSAGLAKQRVTDKLRMMLAELPSDEADQVAIAARDTVRERAHLDPV
jgi:hypothetical protein